MKESYGKGLAVHTGPESCGGARKDTVEALTGVRAGQVSSRETGVKLWDADAILTSGRQHSARRYGKTLRGPTRSKTLRMHGNISRENRDIQCLPA